jgi:membrane fusion protein (multidrug efflux system)
MKEKVVEDKQNIKEEMLQSMKAGLQVERQNQRIFLFKVLATVVIVIGFMYGLYCYFIASNHIETDNAYVAVDMAKITSLTQGTVKEVKVSDTDTVKKNDILVVLDDIDANLGLDNAKAELAKAEANFNRAKINYERREKLIKLDAVSHEEVSIGENDFKAAQAMLDSAQVLFKQSQVNFDRTIIKSPIDGVVAKLQVEIGQRVQPGVVFMSIVPIDQVYINANLKEVQLKKIKIGQPVKVYSDLYGSSITYRGTIAGIAGGTGAAFSIIPAQNATGNWIKVVQRLPIKIALDREELLRNPLRVGLSMHVDIDVAN